MRLAVPLALVFAATVESLTNLPIAVTETDLIADPEVLIELSDRSSRRA